MVKSLTHLRDFMDEETLKFLPGNLRSANFIFLRQNKKDEKGMFNIVLQVFDKDGTRIGCIEHPDYIPSNEH